MTENQKLREALRRIKHESASLADAQVIALEALSLPTAKQVDDINVAESFTSVTKTAAPVGDREVFERTMMDKFGWQRNDFKLDDFGYFDGHTDTAWMAWQARAALSAGDAVDAQRYRWLREQHWSNSDICCVDEPKQNVRLGGTCPSGDLLDAAIDAAMRKDKP